MMFYRMSSYWKFYLPFSGFLNWKQPNPLKAVSYSNKRTYRHTSWTEYLQKGNERRKEKYLKSYFHKGSVVFNTCWPIQARLGMTGQAFACCLGTPSQCVLWKASLFFQNPCYGHIENLCGAHYLWWVTCEITLRSSAVSGNLALWCHCEDRNSFRILHDDSEPWNLS